MKIKGDDVPLCSTVIVFLSLRTTLDWCCDVERDTKFYRVTLIGLVYRRYTGCYKNEDNYLIGFNKLLEFYTMITWQSNGKFKLPVLTWHRLHRCLALRW